MKKIKNRIKKKRKTHKNETIKPVIGWAAIDENRKISANYIYATKKMAINSVWTNAKIIKVKITQIK